MNYLRLTALFGLAAAVAAARADVTQHERNAWPVLVNQAGAAGQPASWNAAGPFLFSRPTTDEPGRQSGFRPLWVQTRDARGDFRSALFLYPLFTYRITGDSYKWSVLELINGTGRRADAPAPKSELERTDGGFDVWPFWFSRQTGDPATSYHAFFPVVGTIKHRLVYDRLSWVVWPLYFRSEKRGAVTPSTPWPILGVTRGTATGFRLWPLFGWQERPSVSRQEF